ncbi:hypothetical protein M5361_00185 [Ligilactobacillus agilis]|nr:hypothetical protein [Ligilactobacillus agilis]
MGFLDKMKQNYAEAQEKAKNDRNLAKEKGSLSKRTDAKILIIIFKLLDGSLIVFLF